MKIYLLSFILLCLSITQTWGQQDKPQSFGSKLSYTVEFGYMRYQQSETEYWKKIAETMGLRATVDYPIFYGQKAGLGFGAMVLTQIEKGDYYSNSGGSLVLPIFAELRGDVTNWKVKPYYAIQLGVGIPVASSFTIDRDNSTERAGLYFSPQLGIKYKTSNKLAMYLMGSYIQQHVQRNYTGWSSGSEQSLSYRRYLLSLGFEF